jgi:hypothetical protein
VFARFSIILWDWEEIAFHDFGKERLSVHVGAIITTSPARVPRVLVFPCTCVGDEVVGMLVLVAILKVMLW